MTDLIPQLSRPVIHYKIMAAGRNDPAEAFAFAASKMRANDAVCVGIYQKDRPEILREDVRAAGKEPDGAGRRLTIHRGGRTAN